MADNGHDTEVENVNPALIPSKSEQDFLRRVWIEGLGEMIGETKSRWEDAFRTVKAEATATIAELRAASAEFRANLEAMTSERLAQIRPLNGKDGRPGERGQKGDKGDPGELPMVRAWSEDDVSYAGDVVTCEGGTWQARKDTSKKPPHRDWVPLAVAGRNAASPFVRGTFDPVQNYNALNIVAMNGSAFIARCDDPGECPGDGWQLIASAGRAGKPGPKGERGERGLPGLPVPYLVRGYIDGFTLTLILSDTSKIEIPIRAAFEKYHEEANG